MVKEIGNFTVKLVNFPKFKI